jgi:TolB protein
MSSQLPGTGEGRQKRMHASIRLRWAARSVLVLAALLLAVPACSAHRSGSGAPYSAAGIRGTMVTSPRSALYVASPTGGPARPLLSPAEAARLGSESDPAWSPDGQQIAFAAGCASCPTKLYVVSRNGNDLRKIPTGQGEVSSPGWSPGGHSIVFARQQGDDQFLYSVDIRTDRIRLVNSEPPSADNSDSTPAWSPGGRWIAFAREVHHEQVGLWETLAAGGPPRRLTRPQPDEQIHPHWSPNGRRIVFMQAMPPLFTWDLFIFDVRTRAGRMLTTSPGNEYDPAWSPNGGYIVFASDLGRQTGFRSLYVIKADGSGLRRLTATAQDDSMPSWSPSGTQIVFVRRPTMRV